MSIWSKIYSKINWKDEPIEETPLSARNLNKMDAALDEIDKRVVEVNNRVETLVTAEQSGDEVTDIRVGYDGTIYPSAGASVRSQVSKLSESIDENYSELKGDLDHISKRTSQLIDKSKVTSGYYDTRGVFFENDKYVHTELIDVSSHHGETIYFSVGGKPKKARFVTAFNESSAIQTKGGVDVEEYLIDDEIKSIYISYENPLNNYDVSYGLFQAEYGARSSEYLPFGRKAYEFDDAFSTKTSNNLINFDTLEDGYMDTDGVVTTSGAGAYYKHTSKIIVAGNQGKTIKFSLNGKPIPAKFITVFAANTNTVYKGRGATNVNEYTIHDDGLTSYIVISFHNFDLEQYSQYKHFQAEYDNITPFIKGGNDILYSDDLEVYFKGLNNIEACERNHLYGKTYYALGDSFTAYTNKVFEGGEYKGRYMTYPYLIGLRNNMRVINLAKSGASLSNIVPTNNISDSLYREICEDADYITIKIGINDCGSQDAGTQAPIGTIDDTNNDTFYGAWNTVLGWLITNRPFAKIGIIISNGMVGNTSYNDATRAIAKKYGIPTLDEDADEKLPLLHRTNRVGVSDTVNSIKMNNFRISETDTHPNYKAHEYESTFVENWLRSL